MADRFNPDMLTLARELRGFTQTTLHQESGVAQSYISQMEHGDRVPSTEKLDRLAKALRVPATFFSQSDPYEGLGWSVYFYRKRASVTQSVVRRIEAEVNLRKMHMRRMLARVTIADTSRRIEHMDVFEYDGRVEEVAQLVRASWYVPLGPIRNLVGVIESAGGIVFAIDMGTNAIDALSQWPEDMPPLFFINTRAPTDRMRFSLAHELGHVILHDRASDTMEDEADRFASELLMPEKIIRHQLVGMTLTKAAQLKPAWRVSMAALIRRARHVGAISQQQYSALFKVLSKRGLRKNEGNSIAPEYPRLFHRIRQAHLEELGGDWEAAARDLAMHAAEVRDLYADSGAPLRLVGGGVGQSPD